MDLNTSMAFHSVLWKAMPFFIYSTKRNEIASIIGKMFIEIDRNPLMYKDLESKLLEIIDIDNPNISGKEKEYIYDFQRYWKGINDRIIDLETTDKSLKKEIALLKRKFTMISRKVNATNNQDLIDKYLICPRCNKKSQKKGYSKRGFRQFYCPSCHKSYTETTYYKYLKENDH